MALEVTPSSPATGFGSLQDEISYYKTQYEQLESELQEFQASSRELEAELEKEAEASDKKVRDLKKKVETLNYEVDEWKNKYKQSKTEANSAQNTLQKEVTALRETNRELQLRLRDTEVANDDFERQARNTTSSLEDMESKYNVALERGVMMEEEIKNGEQERETLRIDAQRLKDELSDLKVEAEITQEKLRAAEKMEPRIKRISQISDPQEQGPRSPVSEKSIISESRQSVSTPPLKSEASTANSDAPTPPSPPLSETSGGAKPAEPIAALKKPSVPKDPHTTPRPSHYAMGQSRHARGPSLAGVNATPSFARSTKSRPSHLPQEPLPRSGSLYQIRGLIGKMEKLEQRVHSARSKLPAPTNTPPRASPRGTANGASTDVPSTVTIRSGRKQSHMGLNDTTTPSRQSEDPMLRHSQSRLSFGTPSAASRLSRPSSQASYVSHGDATHSARPGSRTSVHTGRSAAEAYRPNSALDGRRPRSSMSGNHSASHGPRASQHLATSEEENVGLATPTARRTTLDRNGLGSAIPAPATPGALRSRQSMSGLGTPGRRQSFKVGGHAGASNGNMGPPPPAKPQQQYDDDNTY